jgi:hypothetical protein
MPEFRHTRTGKIIHASEADAFRYRNNRYEPIGEASVRVPDGTVAEVLDWAGDDESRRAAALAVEKTGKNRKGIIDALAR